MSEATGNFKTCRCDCSHDITFTTAKLLGVAVVVITVYEYTTDGTALSPRCDVKIQMKLVCVPRQPVETSGHCGCV